MLNSLLVFVASRSAFCALCTCMLLAQANICSLVITLVFLTMVHAHIISVIVSSLFMPLINCSFRHLSFYLYSHSFTLSQKCPIHSLAYSPCCLISSEYCKDSMVSLCCGFNCSLSISNSPMLVCHFLCSLSFNACMNCSLCQTS